MLNEAEFMQLINDKLGILIHEHQRADLVKTIQAACQKFHCTPSEYLNRLKACAVQSPMLDYLVSGITVGETYFFRDKSQVALLEKTLLPNLIATQRTSHHPTIRIWSAGCASGEEIYTIAMMLNELLPDIDKWTINLLGTDINPKVLHKALEGKYTEWSMRSISDAYKTKYFTKQGQNYLLSTVIKDRVKFDYLNLNDDSYPAMMNGTNAQDIILCRNVLIYFDMQHVGRIMKKFSACLNPDGILILGASDPIQIEASGLTFHHHLGIVFSKQPVPSVKKEVSTKPVALPVVKKPKAPPVAAATVSQPVFKIEQVEALQQEGQWQAVLDTISVHTVGDQLAVPLLNAKGLAYANLGQLDKAKKVLEQSLLQDDANKETYYAYALTLNELNEVEKACAALRKTLFLDHEFVLGHYQLGLLLLRDKQEKAGIKCLHNALDIARHKEAAQAVPYAMNMTYGRLAEILVYEIELYTSMGASNAAKA